MTLPRGGPARGEALVTFQARLAAMLGPRTLIAWGAPVALIVAHQLVAPRGATVVGGVPLELLTRLAWIAAARAYQLWFTRAVWTDREGAENSEAE
ncbi:MAG: hypothetical protein VXW31_07735 [Planctomycetota bacterium]|nr:hypothetical protein [Planctomycetota bacterium]